MVEKVAGNFYNASIEKSNVVLLDGKVLNFCIDISCEDGKLFRELIEYIENFHNPKLCEDKDVV